jgi:putative oxidoreductase
MTLATLVSRGRTGLSALAARLQPLPPLISRVLLGQAFVQTGIGKWRHFDDTVAFFSGAGIPMPLANAAFVASLEVAGGLALVLGAGTRAFAALLASTMVVALLTADRAAFLAALAPGAAPGLTQVAPVMFLAVLAWLAVHGAGALSVDRVLLGRGARANASFARAATAGSGS